MDRTSVPCTRYLPDGGRLRMRMLRASDQAGLAALLERAGRHEDVLELRRLVHFDPRERLVLCVSLWTGSVPVLVGYAAGPRAGDRRPDIVVADEALALGVTAALVAVFAEVAAARGRHAA